jgi:hypothetical protein
VIYVRHVLLPLFGHGLALSYAEGAGAAFAAGSPPWTTVGFGALAILAALAYAAWRWREASAWLIVAGLGLAGVSYIGAIRSGPLLLDPEFATRYAFAPQVFFGLALLAASRRSRVAGWMVVWVLAVAAVGYVRPLPDIAHGPDWRAETQAWRRDREHRLAAWPKGWFVDLAPTGRRCSSRADDPDPPDFCDQYWEKL